MTNSGQERPAVAANCPPPPVVAAPDSPASVLALDVEGHGKSASPAISESNPHSQPDSSGPTRSGGAAATPPQPVCLRVEVATKGQARLIAWSVYAVNTLFILLALGLLSMRSSVDFGLAELDRFHGLELILGGVCLGLLVVTLVWFAYSVHRSQREGREWTPRRKFFAGTASVLLSLQVLYAASFVAAFAAKAVQPNCQYPWRALAACEFLQWTFFSAYFFFLLSRLQDMTLWRGAGALEMKPDFRLVADRPLADKAHSRKIVFAIWCLLEAAAVLTFIDRMQDAGDLGQPPGCDMDMGQWECGASVKEMIAAVISFLMVLGFLLYWIMLVRRSLRDHAQLPYNRYRSTHLFVRVQARLIAPALTAIGMSVLLLSLLPAVLRNGCWGTLDSRMGNLPVLLSLTVASILLAVLYMPTNALDTPLLQAFLQEFSWTQAALPASIEQRNQRLEAAAPAAGVGELSFAGVVGFLPGKVAEGLARLAGIQDQNAAAEQLRNEPMYCVETAVRLFYWARLAYRDESELENYPFLNASDGLRLFALEHFETCWANTTDTHCVLGWSSQQVVLAFRGTSSLQNVMTDVKAWQTALLPKRRRAGQVVRVHAGFYKAWVQGGFREKVIEKLQKVQSDAQPGAPLQFWITGHSLGGALAVLAALEISKLHPDSKIIVYTWGCPRVGNMAFADEYDEAVPDTWAIQNGLDPIPWIPKGAGFRRVGKRVTIDAKGDLILRPTYFELSLTHRGTSTKHHMTLSYAQSLAAVFKAQFVPSKQFSCGAEGVEQLAAAVDLSQCLQLTHLDPASLRDPKVLPLLAEQVAARQATVVARKRSSRGSCGNTDSWCGMCGHLCGSLGRQGAADAGGSGGEEKPGCLTPEPTHAVVASSQALPQQPGQQLEPESEQPAPAPAP